jgi:cell division protein FtsI (penicillin-binding protein 3)
VTASAVLSELVVTPLTSFVLPYSIHVADRVIHDSELRGTEQMSVAQIFARSSNVGTVTLAELLGATRLARWISRFGFGHKTGIDYPGESPGIVLPLDRWSGSTIGTVPIGQGIAVTPVQMAAAYAAVANGGVFVRPHLVERIGRHRPRPARRRIISRAVAGQLTALMQDVVAQGTGVEAAVPGYRVAGKTGTAQKPGANGTYAKGAYVSSFVGFVPASAPRLVILVMVDEPRGGYFGGKVAAPAFQRIARFALQYFDVPPDGTR